MNPSTFGATETQDCNTTFGGTDTNTNAAMTVSCLDIYNHSSKDYTVAAGTSIDSFFKNDLNINAAPKNFIVKINGLNAEAGQVLQPGDSVQVTPTKIQGGC
jgi:hypothetical protein